MVRTSPYKQSEMQTRHEKLQRSCARRELPSHMFVEKRKKIMEKSLFVTRDKGEFHLMYRVIVPISVVLSAHEHQ